MACVWWMSGLEDPRFQINLSRADVAALLHIDIRHCIDLHMSK